MPDLPTFERPSPMRIAIVGYGKIAADQHVPAIAADPAFELAATVSRRRAGPPGVPAFASIAELRASGLQVDAVALCNTPGERAETALEALAADWHVLMEKPPAATLGAVERIAAAAETAGRTLFASWHSRFAPAVEQASALLHGKSVETLEIDWFEDVRKWHPGQDWIWGAGGFGVFDPGINALSIATEILPVELCVASATLEIPSNRQMPIAATLLFDGPAVPQGATACFDWRAREEECWEIRIVANGRELRLLDGGARLLLDGVEQPVAPGGEYPRLYRHFARLLERGESEVDVRPLRLVADAFLAGERQTTEAFAQ